MVKNGSSICHGHDDTHEVNPVPKVGDSEVFISGMLVIVMVRNGYNNGRLF